MLPPISQRGLDGESSHEMPLTWHFGQVFGERSPGEEVLDGALYTYTYIVLVCSMSDFIYCISCS